MSTKKKVISASAISFTAGTGFGLWIFTMILAFLVKYNQEAFERFFKEAVQTLVDRIVYGEPSERPSASGRIRYNTPPLRKYGHTPYHNKPTEKPAG